MHDILINTNSFLVQIVSDFPEFTAAVERALASPHVDTIVGFEAFKSTIRRPLTAVIYLRRRIASDKQPAKLANDLQAFAFRDGPTYHYSKSQGRYYIVAGDEIDGLIDLQEHKVEWSIGAVPEIKWALHLLILNPLSLLLPQYDLLILHAAAVAYDNIGILLIAPSGSGKSTLSFLLSHCQQMFTSHCISDDSVLVDLTDDLALVHPIHTGFGLPRDLAYNNLAPEMIHLGHDINGKVYVAQVPNQAAGGVPISRIIYLNKTTIGSEITRIEALDQRETLRLLVSSQTSIPNPNLIKRLALYRRLANQAIAARITFVERCDVEALASWLASQAPPLSR